MYSLFFFYFPANDKQILLFRLFHHALFQFRNHRPSLLTYLFLPIIKLISQTAFLSLQLIHLLFQSQFLSHRFSMTGISFRL